jgi:hypothetical protein
VRKLAGDILFTRRGRHSVAVFLLAGLFGNGAAAQTVSVVPDERSLVILVRTTLTALDQANRTGNYGVFRDLGSPSFYKANSEARLAAIFGRLREQKIDMQPVAILDPRFTHKPFVDQKNLLRLTGFFETRPLRIDFDIAFELAGGQWKLFGIAVDPAAPVAPLVPSDG